MANRYLASDLLQKFQEYRTFKQPILRDWRIIRSLYKGQFWQIFSKYLKDYTITPDWNYFDHTVQAYLNSIYSGAFIGTLSPRYDKDASQVQALNAFINYQWNKWGMKNKFLHIGENAELYNVGAVRVDWDHRKNSIVLRALSPQELYFDPSVDSYKDGEAIFIERAINIDLLKKKLPDAAQLIEQYAASHKNAITDKTRVNRIAGFENMTGTNNKMVSLIECFIRNDEGFMDQIFILDEAEIIFERLDIPLERFPIVCYAPQRPDGGPFGDSKLIKIMNTTIALNLLDSMEATQPYRVLNRVRFVNVDGRINMRAFADYGNTPNASFQVKGAPKDLVSYVDVPTIPDLSALKQRLENSIFQVTGVDPYYKGRMTNSLQTTGATEAFQARVTMLTDNARITLLEEFCEDLTRLVLDFYFEYGGKKTYHVPKKSVTGSNKIVADFEIDFAKMRGEGVKYDYTIAASTLLPMNQANLFASAKALYEMQGQYQFKTPVVTEADLVRFSDFPQKDQWIQRIERDEKERTGETLVADLTNFANIFSRLISSGLSEEQAAQEAINMLIEEKNLMKQDPSVGQGFR